MSVCESVKLERQGFKYHHTLVAFEIACWDFAAAAVAALVRLGASFLRPGVLSNSYIGLGDDILSSE